MSLGRCRNLKPRRVSQWGLPRAAAADSGSSQPCLVGSPTGRAKDFLGDPTSLVRRMLPRGPASEAVTWATLHRGTVNQVEFSLQG